MVGVVPEYYFAKPRLEHLRIPPTVRTGIWRLAPKGHEHWFYLAQMVPLMFGEASTFPYFYFIRKSNLTSITRLPLYTRVPMFMGWYLGTLAIARISVELAEKGFRYGGRIEEEYSELYPHKFPEYQVKKYRETFAPWYPIRSGSADTRSWTFARGKKAETDHYIEHADERAV